MPGAFLSIFLRLPRDDDRRSRFVARRRRGVGAFRRRLNRASARRRFDRRRYGERGYRGRRHGEGGSRVPRRHHQNGAARLPAQALGPVTQPFAPVPVQAHVPAVPLVPAVADWLYAGPASPMLPDDPVAPVEAVPPPGNDVIILDDDEHEAAPLPSPTPVVVEVAASDALAYVSAPTGSTVFTFGSGVGSFSNAAAADSAAPPRLQSPTPAVEDDAVPPGYVPSPIGRGSPATPPSSARAGVRRRLLALGVPLASPPSSSRGNRASTRSPTTLGLANGVSNSMASSHSLLGGSSSEEVDGARRR